MESSSISALKAMLATDNIPEGQFSIRRQHCSVAQPQSILQYPTTADNFFRFNSCYNNTTERYLLAIPELEVRFVPLWLSAK
ncbi:unnamed protein product [Thelazia callipaeda]|uniref:Ovule protein n=1 Tax=Thelazia callipaeda TaxID=103827 RepID=A0A0N5DBN6_THECL|nr:unnamed protein product [Thelazia callipaeda]